MELILIGTLALLFSCLTFFSGFGLGTTIMPVFALFFPLQIAIAATAIVHFTNNLFKLLLMVKQTNWQVVARFSIPAAIAAMLGAGLLLQIGTLPFIISYNIGNSIFEVTTIKIVIGGLIVIVAGLELSKRFKNLSFPLRWLSLGGILSGFIGGLSGNQGALRSAFLIRSGLSKDAFVATSIVSSVIVDAARISVYASGLLSGIDLLTINILPAVSIGIAGALLGSLFGMYLLKKITINLIQKIVAIMLFCIGIGLIVGLL